MKHNVTVAFVNDISGFHSSDEDVCYRFEVKGFADLVSQRLVELEIDPETDEADAVVDALYDVLDTSILRAAKKEVGVRGADYYLDWRDENEVWLRLDVKG